MEIILASKSPRRLEILSNLGFFVRVVPSDADESISEPLSPPDLVRTLAERKLACDVACNADDLVIACDTVVCFEGEILGKPKSAEDAKRMLHTLSGKTHSVFSGLAMRRGGVTISDFERTDVHFRELSDEEIDAYIKSGEPFDKAGSYGIQGKGGLFAERIDGDYFNVMGLPVHLFGRMFAKITGSEVLCFNA